MAAHSPRLVGMAEQVAHVDSAPEDRKAGEKLGGWQLSVLGCGEALLAARQDDSAVCHLCLLSLPCLRTRSWEIWGFHTAVLQVIRTQMIRGTVQLGKELD